MLYRVNYNTIIEFFLALKVTYKLLFAIMTLSYNKILRIEPKYYNKIILCSLSYAVYKCS